MNGALLTQLLPIVSAVIGSGAFLAVFTDRRKRAADAAKSAAEGHKAGAEGQVALSGTTLEWTRTFSAEAEKARERAEKAEQRANEATTRADQCARDQTSDRKRIAELERHFELLLAHHADTCPAGEECPVTRALQL